MVDPDLMGAEDGDAVAVGPAPPPEVRRGDPYVCVARRFAVVHVDVVDDDVGHILQCDAAVAHDVNIRAATVDGLVAVEDQLMLQLYGHVRREYYPARIRERYSMSFCVCIVKIMIIQFYF